MAFNSPAYIIFLSLVVFVYYLIRQKYKWILILLAGLIFFLSFTPKFLPVYLLSVFINYYFTYKLDNIGNISLKRKLLIGLISFNVVLLIAFKYFDLSNIFGFLNFMSFNNKNSIIIPIGISFYTFKVISYNVDVYNRKLKAEKNFGIFTTYCFFFPNLVQGPIDRAVALLNQFKEEHKLDYSNISLGFRLIILGLFKKLVVADRISIYTSTVFANYENHTGITLIIATLFYSVQIYADFSGYSDIAIGSAKLMGINLMKNFNLPYFAKTISEFWQRWHISLSTWLRDYIFLPVAYKSTRILQKYNIKRYSKDLISYIVATTITFAICGLWHGTSLNFLIWGLIYAFYMSFGRITDKFRKSLRLKLKIKNNSFFYNIFRTSIVFLLVSFAWIFFYSKSLNNSFEIIKKIISIGNEIYFLDAQSTFVYSVFGIMSLFIIDYSDYINLMRVKFKIVKLALYSFLILIILYLGVFNGGQFIYFKF